MILLLDKNKRPLGWCKPDHARRIMQKGNGVFYRHFPQVLIVKNRDVRTMPEIRYDYRVKVDPGAKYTGITVVDGDTVVLFARLEHRGEEVRNALQTRSSARRNRRNRETSYRRCKFRGGRNARTARPEGWLPPSQISISDNVINFLNRLHRFIGTFKVTFECVRFDTQLMDNPDIQGVEYQQGELLGYEMRQYLLEKYQHTCQYCGGKSGDDILEWEHIRPKSRGGTDSLKNATLSCCPCNREKNTMLLDEWEADINAKPVKTELDAARLKGIQNVREGKKVQGSNRYAAWSQASKWRTVNKIQEMPFVEDVELTSGGRTAYNRKQMNLKKDHHLDALCMGKTNPEAGYKHIDQPVLYVKAKGRGNRFRGLVNSCGVIVTKFRDSRKRMYGFQTGDIVRAVIPAGKYAGTYVGRITIRHRPSFALKPFNGKKIDVNPAYMQLLQREDGYAYAWA